MKKCVFCGNAIYRSGKPRCYTCRMIFCSNCSPFYQSQICPTCFNMIPESNKKEFKEFCRKIDNGE